MCILTSTAIGAGISIALGAMGTALGVVSGIQQTKAQEAQAKYQIQVQNENARIMREKAKQEAQEGLNKERLQRMKNLQAIGLQKTSLASRGSDINFGTSLDLIEDKAIEGELDALNIRYDTQKKVREYDQNAIDFSNKADYTNSMFKFQKQNSLLNGIKSGINTLADYSSNGFKII